ARAVRLDIPAGDDQTSDFDRLDPRVQSRRPGCNRVGRIRVEPDRSRNQYVVHTQVARLRSNCANARSILDTRTLSGGSFGLMAVFALVIGRSDGHNLG